MPVRRTKPRVKPVRPKRPKPKPKPKAPKKAFDPRKGVGGPGYKPTPPPYTGPGPTNTTKKKPAKRVKSPGGNYYTWETQKPNIKKKVVKPKRKVRRRA